MSGLPDRSRVQVTLAYLDTIFRQIPNHTILCYESDDKILFTDPQIGVIIKTPELYYSKGVASEGVRYCRIDNLEISDRGITACKEVRP